MTALSVVLVITAIYSVLLLTLVPLTRRAIIAAGATACLSVAVLLCGAMGLTV
jgi:hypothetical protein